MGGCWRVNSERRCLLSSEAKEEKRREKGRKVFSIALSVTNWLGVVLSHQVTILSLFPYL